MVEFSRFEQVQELMAHGWYVNEECALLAEADAGMCGAPTYLYNPKDGKVHAVSCGKTWIVKSESSDD